MQLSFKLKLSCAIPSPNSEYIDTIVKSLKFIVLLFHLTMLNRHWINTIV